jgi:TonB-linked SusC/RagA family outer membrane protein
MKKNASNIYFLKSHLLIFKKIFIVGILLFTGLIAFAQQPVTGTVNDANTGEALAGVTVMIRGTTLGTLTDASGQFTLRIPDKQGVLTFSFIGYTTQDVTVTQGSRITVAMQLEITEISEVVVVGYGTQKKESVVGAITQVKSEALMRSGTQSVTNAIAGKLSGVLTIQQSGEPGINQAEIVVRGLSSWNSSAPLVLVDGVEREFKDLNPNEINTISVLKDASATAVFGAKGANGVILVTTNRGSLSKPKMDFSVTYGGSRATDMPDFIDSYTTATLLNVGLMNAQRFTELIPQSVLNEYRNPSTRLNSVRYPNVDWYKLLTKPYAPEANANLNVRGGTEAVKYFFALGFNNEGSFFEGATIGQYDMDFGAKRFNYRTNVDYNLTKSTMLSMNLGGVINIIKNGNQTNFWRKIARQQPGRFPPYYPEWVLEEVPDPDYPNDEGIRLTTYVGGGYGNPYADMNSSGTSTAVTAIKNIQTTLFLDLLLDQKLDFIIKGLSAKGKVSVSSYASNRDITGYNPIPTYTLYFDRIGLPGVNPWFREGQGNEIYYQAPLYFGTQGTGQFLDYYKTFYYETTLNYNNTFGKHNITAMILANWQEKGIKLEFPYYNQAFVGRTTYDYSRKYMLEINVGYTGSERFAPGNRYGLFPAGALGWMISEEEFFKNAIPWINKLKIRYSDGVVGSDYASSRWLYMSDFYFDNSGYILEDLAANLTAQWEQARKKDIGIEAGFFKDLLTLTIDLFDERRSKMLLAPNSATMIVGNEFKMQNLGSTKKHGIEIEAQFNKTTPSGLTYFISGNFGFNENRVVFKDDLLFAEEFQKAAGKPLGTNFNGAQVTGTGYFTSIDDIHINPSPLGFSSQNVGHYKYLDYRADGQITVLDLHPIKGLDYPPFTSSLAGGLSYKRFTFNVMFMGNFGKYVNYNQAYENEFSQGVWRVHESQLDYWTPANQGSNHETLQYYDGNIPNLVWGGGSSEYGYTSLVEGRHWRNADYVRLKDIYIGYSVSPAFLKRKLGISGLTIHANANNLWTITKLIEGDPERKSFLNDNYPQVTTVKFGVKIDF